MTVEVRDAVGDDWQHLLGKAELEQGDVTELRDIRTALTRRIENIRGQATTESRRFSGAESEQIERFDRQIAAIGEAIDRGVRALDAQRAVPAPEAPAYSLGGLRSGDGSDESEHHVSRAGGSTELSGALRSVDRLVRRDAMSDRAAVRLEGLLRTADPQSVGARYIEAVSDPNYRSAFLKILARPQDAHMRMSPAELEAVQRVDVARRAMSIGTGSTGGYAVPVELDPTILLSSDGSVNPLRQIARVEATFSGTWKGITSEGVTASYVAEATEASDDSPTLVQPSITAERAQAFVPFSIEAEQDIAELAVQLGALFADSRDQLEASKFTSGGGHSSNEPSGVVAALSGGASAVDTAASGTFAAADVYSAIEALPGRFQARAQWCANLAVLNAIRRMGPVSDEPSLFSADGSTLLGKPFNELSPMDSDPTTSGQEILLVGDFQQFLITDRLGMVVEVVPHVFGANNRPTGQRGLYAIWRNSSAVLVPNAFRLLTVQ